jgi:alginate O-acetyltransferase complex protein AlgI
MLFNSLKFLIFFPTVVSAYFLIPFRFRWVLLLIASYIFYAAWEPAYLILIVMSTLVDYVAGIQMGKINDRSKRRKYLILSLISNLGLLFTFKYFNFFNDTFHAAFNIVGIPYDIPTLDVLLPVGISFYTFSNFELHH